MFCSPFVVLYQFVLFFLVSYTFSCVTGIQNKNELGYTARIIRSEVPHGLFLFGYLFVDLLMNSFLFVFMFSFFFADVRG